MATVGQPYTSGQWLVKAGQEEEFVKRWTAFASWSKENAAGSENFQLIQDKKSPQRFISFGAWQDDASVDAWRQMPEFAEGLGKCRELCDDFQPGDYSLRAAG